MSFLEMNFIAMTLVVPMLQLLKLPDQEMTMDTLLAHQYLSDETTNPIASINLISPNGAGIDALVLMQSYPTTSIQWQQMTHFSMPRDSRHVSTATGEYIYIVQPTTAVAMISRHTRLSKLLPMLIATSTKI